MHYAIFRCCVTNRSLREYETASDAVLTALDIKAADIKEFGCCGYPLKNVNFKAAMYLAARNFALAGRSGAHLLTVCNCCFASLKQARQLLAQDPELSTEIAQQLADEDLVPAPEVEVRHLLQVLYHNLGPQDLTSKISRPLQGLKVVMHYGCHLLRPSEILAFDNPFDPVICEQLVRATGAECLTWNKRLDCCGAPLGGIFDDLSSDMATQKLTAARQAGAHCLLVVCPFCHLQISRARQIMTARGEQVPPVFSIVQLLSTALGKSEALIGLNEAKTQI